LDIEIAGEAVRWFNFGAREGRSVVIFLCNQDMDMNMDMSRSIDRKVKSRKAGISEPEIKPIKSGAMNLLVVIYTLMHCCKCEKRAKS
jgi:hypothetical protein